MLPEQYRQLLTAYVDGELSGRQRRNVDRLLKRSPDARTLLRLLQQDAAAVSGLTAPKLDQDLSAHVLRTIRERRLSPFRPKLKPLAPAYPAWVALAVAASVLCAIGFASYLGFAALFAKPGNKSSVDPLMVKKPDQVEQPFDVTSSGHEERHEQEPNLVRNDTPPQPKEFVGPPAPDPREEKPPVEVVKVPVPDTELHGPPDPRKEPLTNPAMERFKPEIVVGSSKPIILKLHDLDQAEPRKKLLDELTQATGFRVELPCDNGTKAFDRLQAACKNLKISVLIDQKAQQRIKKPQDKTNYVLYLENVTPDELARLVQQIGVEDKKAAAKKPADALLKMVVVTRLTKLDYKELSDLLGIDAAKVEPPKATGPLGTDLSKPLFEQTADQVGKALDGKKAVSKSDDVHQALVLAYNPVLPPKNSPEVKLFLEGRKPAKPDTIRAIIVLRSM